MKFDKFDRQKFILFTTKYIAYIINTVIILAVVAGVAMWVRLLIQSAQ